MDFTHLPDEFFKISEQLMNRRKFFKGVGMVGVGAADAECTGSDLSAS